MRIRVSRHRERVCWLIEGIVQAYVMDVHYGTVRSAVLHNKTMNKT